MRKFLIATAAIVVTFATPATALAKGKKVNLKAGFAQETHIRVGKMSAGHASAAAVGLNNGDVAIQGTAATAIDLGKVKISNEAGGSLHMPLELLKRTR